MSLIRRKILTGPSWGKEKKKRLQDYPEKGKSNYQEKSRLR